MNFIPDQIGSKKIHFYLLHSSDRPRPLTGQVFGFWFLGFGVLYRHATSHPSTAGMR